MDIFDYCQYNNSDLDNKEFLQLKNFFNSSLSVNSEVDELLCFSLLQAEFVNALVLAEDKYSSVWTSVLPFTNFRMDQIISFESENDLLSLENKEKIFVAKQLIVAISDKVNLDNLFVLLSLLEVDDLLLITDESLSQESVLKSLVQYGYAGYNKKIFSKKNQFNLIVSSLNNYGAESNDLKASKGLKVNCYSSNLKGIELIVSGKNNYIYIDEKVKIGKAIIKIQGDNNYIYIGKKSNINGKLHIQGSYSFISIGENVRTTSADTRLFAQENNISITIGRGGLLSRCIFRTSDSHSILDNTTGMRINNASSIVLEDNVWIAEDVKVLKGTHIARDSIVAAGSTAIGKLNEPFSIYAGLPAKIIKSNITWVEERV